MSKTILVTGACGFTGSHMLEHLAEQAPDAQIVATDLPGSERSEYYVEAPDSDAPQPVYYGDIHEQLGVEFIPADLTDEAAVRTVGTAYDYDEVYHIASLFDYFADRETLYAVNVDGTQNLLSELASQESSCRLIHWSTLGVLGDAGFSEPKTETSAYKPHNRYCESKVVQEQVVRAFGGQLDVTVIRPAPIYGPRHQYGLYHIPKLLEKLRFAPVSRLYPRSRQLQFPCVHVDDVVRAATYLARRSDAIGERYNLLSNSIGQDELLSFFASKLSLRRLVMPTPYPLYWALARSAGPIFYQYEKIARLRDIRPLIDAPMVRYLTANMWFANEKLKSTGFEFRYEDPRDGLAEYIEWCQHHGYLHADESDDTAVQSEQPAPSEDGGSTDEQKTPPAPETSTESQSVLRRVIPHNRFFDG